MAANTANLGENESDLSLDTIRSTLMRMEDSIIFSLIERSQYRINSAAYEPNCNQLNAYKLHQLKSVGSNGCLGDWIIYQTECLHSQVQRYIHPTQYSFFGPLPAGTLGKPADFRKPSLLAPVPEAAVVNKQLLEIYRTKMIPVICEEGDCGNHGSSSLQDVHVLQLMATLIYYGLFVAEMKFRSERGQVETLIKAKDRDGLMDFITKRDVEIKNVNRVVLKARTFGQDIPSGESGQLAPMASLATTYKVPPEFIGTVFQDFLMPLFKEVEVEYLLARLDNGDVTDFQIPPKEEVLDSQQKLNEAS